MALFRISVKKEIFLEPREKHEHFVLATKNGFRLGFTDARRFGMIDLLAHESNLSGKVVPFLGPDPLIEAEFTDSFLKKHFLAKKSSIKSAIMDQKIVAGMGNIYASEALFFAKIHPARGAQSLNDREVNALKNAIIRVFQQAILAGGSSLKDYIHVDGGQGGFQNQHSVYGRNGKKCLICHNEIEHIRQAGRSSFFCPACQK